MSSRKPTYVKTLTSLRDAAVFAPCYVALDWASYIDPVGPFNITPWNPQPALAIVWMMLAGLRQSPAVLLTIILADIAIRHAPGGYAFTLVTGAVLTTGYAAIAGTLKALLRETGLRSTRQLTVFAGVVLAGSCVVGAAFVSILHASGLLGDTAFGNAWVRFWIGDAVGILVTAPLLFAAADHARRTALVELVRKPEALMQAAALAATVWLIFKGLGTDPSRHFYLLFLPLIWIAVRHGMNGAIAATGIVQIGVVLGIHAKSGSLVPVVELQALMAALTLTGLYLGVMVDQRQRAEENLRHSLRLAAAGEMAGAIAHEVNQPLTAVSNYGRSAQVLLQRELPDSQVGEIVRKMLAESDRASEVVRRLRDFFRAGTTRLEQVDPSSLVASMRRIAQAEIGSRTICFEIVESPALRPLLVDKLQVEVILRNLIANAVESVGGAERPDGRISMRLEAHDDGHVRIAIVDNGPGIPASERATLFEPFVSGKPTGMGLGLAVSRSIAEAHGGALEAAATAHGEFHLILPCAPSA